MKPLKISAVLFPLLLAACAMTGLTPGNFARIQDGMSEAEVIAILGEPQDMLSLGFGPLGGSNAVWKDTQATVTVQFLNGQVKGKQFISHGAK
jgi:hypothetical protein